LSPPSNVPGLQPEREDRNVVDPPGKRFRRRRYRGFKFWRWGGPGFDLLPPNEYPPEQAQQQGGPTEIPRKRWIWGDKNSPWSSPGRSVGTRPEFEGEVPIHTAPPENPRDFKRWAYERLQRWYQENPGQTPPPHILDDYLYWDQPERRRRNPKRKGWWRPLF